MRFKWTPAAFGFAALALFAMLSTIVSPGPATAQDAGAGGERPSTPVRITGPLPLPVSGTATVSGSVASTQSGEWTVNARNLDEPGRTPYQAQLTGSLPNSPILPAVPAGKRLVIQNVSFNMITPSTTGGYMRMSVFQPAGSAFGSAVTNFPLTFVGTRPGVGTFFVGNFPVAAYVDPSGSVQFLADSGFVSSGTVFIAVSGYMIDCSQASACSS